MRVKDERSEDLLRCVVVDACIRRWLRCAAAAAGCGVRARFALVFLFIGLGLGRVCVSVYPLKPKDFSGLT